MAAFTADSNQALTPVQPVLPTVELSATFPPDQKREEFSTPMTPDKQETPQDPIVETQDYYWGIGVEITYSKLGDDTVALVKRATGGYPAEKAGIRINDMITHVNDMKFNPLGEQIVGSGPTPVKITVYRPSLGKNIDFIMVLEKIRFSND